MPIQTILDVEVTITKELTPYTPRHADESYEKVMVKRGQHLKFDNKNNELIVPIGNGIIRKVRISQKDLESFTEYI